MKLSDAIRLGSMMKPQGYRALSSESGTCALGAALDAISQPDSAPCYHWPIVDDFVVGCPACLGITQTWLGFIIAHLNDDHRWTRERIADWIETLEARKPSDERTTLPVAVDPVVANVGR